MFQNEIRVTPLHDRKGVRVSLENDIWEFSIADAKKALKDLQTAIKQAETEEPPAPAPLTMEEMGFGKWETDAENIFAETSSNAASCFTDLLGHELGLEEMEKLRGWLTKAIKYHKEPDNA